MAPRTPRALCQVPMADRSALASTTGLVPLGRSPLTTRLSPLTSLGRVNFLPTRRKPTAIPSIHPTGRLVHNVPCEFKFETRAKYYRKFGYTGSLAPDTPRNARVTPPTPSTRRERKLLLL